MPDRPRTVLVTGAARGIGRAIAERFAAGGWRVGAFDVDRDALVDGVGRSGAVTGELDVRDLSQWDRALGELCGDGPLDALVNNAGVLAHGRFADMELTAQRRMVEVNLLGVINGCAAGHQRLCRSDRAVVLNLCSASALYGQPGIATYGATKAAVKSLTEALDLEWAADRIAVRSLLPTFVATEMVSRDQAGSTSVRRLGVRLTPVDVAEAAWRVVHERGRTPRGPHRSVGRQARMLAAASAMSPAWAARLAARRIAG